MPAWVCTLSQCITRCASALVPTRTVDGARAVTHGVGTLSVIDEDQVQIRREAQFLAAEAAIAEYREAPTLTGQATVLRREFASGQGEDGRDHRFGKTGQPTRGGGGVRRVRR